MEEPTEKHKTVQKPRRSGGQMLVVALLGAGLGILGTLYAQDLIEVITPVALTVLLTLFAVGVLLYLAITFYRDKIIRYLFGEDIHFDSALTDAQDMVKQTIIGTTEAIPGLDSSKKKQLQQAAPRMANYLIWSRFRSQGLRMMIGFMVAIGGLATTILLFNQNKLLEKQNSQIELQNEKIDMQMSLEESNRRSAMVGQMANLLDKIDEELQDTFNTNHGTRRLSEQLIGRIASLSHGMKPYRYLDGDSLSKDLSPERGQLLLAIVNSDLDTITLDELFRRATFKQADLRNAILDDAYLVGIELDQADLSFSSLDQVKFRHADLSYASLYSAQISEVDFSYSKLMGSDLRWINNREKPAFEGRLPVVTTEPPDTLIISTTEGQDSFVYLSYNLGSDITEYQIAELLSFEGANLEGADLSFADISLMMIRDANLDFATLKGTICRYTDFSRASLKATKLDSTSLRLAIMRCSDLYLAEITDVDFTHADLSGTYLDFAKFQGDITTLDYSQICATRSLYGAEGLEMIANQEFIELNPELFTSMIDSINHRRVVDMRNCSDYLEGPFSMDVEIIDIKSD